MTTQSLSQDSNAVQQSDQNKLVTEDVMSMIRGWMKERNKADPSDPNMTFADAGFDSLDSVELAFFLQDELGVEIDETVLYNYPTFAALAEYVIERL